MLDHCGSGSIVHAGTYFGDFLPALAERSDPQATVWAFEPNRENYRCAERTLELNGIGSGEVVLAHAALGSANGWSTIRVKDENDASLGGASQISRKPITESSRTTETVRMVTLDSAIGKDIDISIVQLDVEGYETEVLKGALNLISRCRPILILENLPGGELLQDGWIRKNLPPIGYRFLGHVHGNVILVCDRVRIRHSQDNGAERSRPGVALRRNARPIP